MCVIAVQAKTKGSSIFLTARLAAPEASVYDLGRSEPCVGRWAVATCFKDRFYK